MRSQFPNATKYEESREIARKRARAKFFAKHPRALPLIVLGGEYVARCILFLSGRDISHIKHGQYVSDLLISFTRTHFVAQDLLGQGEHIEAIVLVRKQLELLARLHEIAKAEKIEGLIRKTPNLRALDAKLRVLYATYSEVAHSAHPIHLQQLGNIKVRGKEYRAVYPVYDPNSIVTFQHLMLTIVEFYRWAKPILSAAYSDYDFKADDELIGEFADAYVKAFR